MQDDNQKAIDAAALTEEGQRATRAMLARDAFVQWRLGDVPAIYYDLVPVTYDAAELEAAEKAIRAQLEADLKLCASPWHPIGPAPAVLDFSKGGRHFIGERFLGMPAAVKPGRDAYGRLYRDYEEVKCAEANVWRTAESVAFERHEQLELEARAASSAYVKAANAGHADASRLETEAAAASDRLAAAFAECQRLRDNPIAACAIVRSAEEGQRAMEAYARSAGSNVAPERSKRREKLL